MHRLRLNRGGGGPAAPSSKAIVSATVSRRRPPWRRAGAAGAVLAALGSLAVAASGSSLAASGSPEPTELRLTPGVESLSASWGVSSTSGLTGFRVRWRTPTAVWSTPVELPASARSYKILSLSAQPYEVRVRAVGTPGLAGSSTATATPLSQQQKKEQPPPPPSGVIIGLTGGSGMGETVGNKLKALGFSSERIEAGGTGSTIAESHAQGWRDDTVLVGNTSDTQPLSTVNTASWVTSTLAQVKEAVADGDTLLEVGNEVETKGTHKGPKGEWIPGQAEPAKYAEMFMALSSAVTSAGLKAQLLFSGGGDYERPNGTWSQIDAGGGWVADALKAQPGLLSAIGGFAQHPYGRAHEDNGEHHGPRGMEDQHANDVALGFKNTNFYVTEYGVQYTPGQEGPSNAPTLALQAQRIKEAFQEFLSLSYVKGIWCYEVHDDNTGSYGLVSGLYEPRPALSTVASFLP